jgi:hypothetical protein
MNMDVRGKNSLCMCPSCWRIQPPEDDLLFEVGQWMEPMAILARMGCEARQHVRFVDTYCNACLIESALRVQLALTRAVHEPLNA